MSASSYPTHATAAYSAHYPTPPLAPLPPPAQWIPDSGATHHMTPVLHHLQQIQPYNGNDHVTVGNGHSMPISNTGTAFCPSRNHTNLVLNEVLHVPHLFKSLFSVHRFATYNKCFFEFHPDSFFVKDKTNKDILLQGKSNKGLYEFSTSSPQAHIHTKSTSFDIWHARLGHPLKAVVYKYLGFSSQTS